MFPRKLPTIASSALLLALTLAPSAHAQTATASAAPSRTNGAAPLAVFFDATATACSGCDAFKDLHYAWDFGDPNSGSWEISGKLKNAAFGPTSAHVFEKAGSYTVTLKVTSPSGQTSSKSMTVSVASEASAWPGAATVCVSTGSTFTGCPAGARQVTAATLTAVTSACASNQRCLLRRGDTFSGGNLQVGGAGPGMLGAFGTGNKPRLVATSGQWTVQFRGATQDWRVADLELAGYSTKASNMLGSPEQVKNVLILRTQNTLGTFHAGMVFGDSSLNFYNEGLHESLFIVENTWKKFGFGSGGNILFVAGKRLAILGNLMDDSTGGEHVIRVTHAEQGVISDNELSRQSDQKAVLTLRSADQNATCTAGCGRPTRDIVVSDNIFRTRDDFTLEIVGKNSSTQTARGVNFIVERNFFTKATGGDAGPQLAGTFVSCSNLAVRNNVVVMDGWQTYRGFESSATGTTMTNNSCYSPAAGNVTCVKLMTAGEAFNNVLYAPNATGTVTSGTTGSNNVLASSNPFVSIDGTKPASFIPRTGSPLIDSGARVFNPLDFQAHTRPSGAALDVGAFESGASAPPVVDNPPAAPTLISVEVVK